MIKELCIGNDTEGIRAIFEETNKVLRESGVGIDMDGVEIDSHMSAIQALNQHFGRNFEKSNYSHPWVFVDFIEEIKADGEIRIDQDAKEFAIDFWNSDLVNDNAPPVEGAMIVSKFLHQNGINAHRITARPSYVKSATHRWYNRKMPWVESQYIHIQNTGKRIYPRFKIEKINQLGLGYYFEDEPGNAEIIAKETNATVIVVPQYWNLDYSPSDTNKIITTSGYNDAPTALRGYLALADRICS